MQALQVESLCSHLSAVHVHVGLCVAPGAHLRRLNAARQVVKCNEHLALLPYCCCHFWFCVSFLLDATPYSSLIF